MIILVVSYTKLKYELLAVYLVQVVIVRHIMSHRLLLASMRCDAIDVTGRRPAVVRRFLRKRKAARTVGIKPLSITISLIISILVESFLFDKALFHTLVSATKTNYGFPQNRNIF